METPVGKNYSGHSVDDMTATKASTASGGNPASTSCATCSTVSPASSSFSYVLCVGQD